MSPRGVTGQRGLVKAIAAAVVITIALFLGHTPAEARTYTAIVVDSSTGYILHQHEADRRVHPASLTKIMALYMVFEALEAGKISLNEKITVSRHAASMPPSNLRLKAGDRITVKQAILALVTKSANDVAAAVGEHLAGTESQFAQAMTRKARQLGMRSTRFRNASGLHHKDQVTTARDMAVLGRRIMDRFPEFYAYFSKRSFSFRGQTYGNHNKLLASYSGTDGIKTGYIRASGFNLVASVEREGRRLVAVVIGGRTGARRDAQMVRLLDRGFDRAAELNLPIRTTPPVPGRKPGAGFPDAQIASTGGELYDRTQTGGDIDDGRIPTPLPNQEPVRFQSGRWAIQVGAFSSETTSLDAARSALANVREFLAGATPSIVPVQVSSNNTLYRARLVGLDRATAHAACEQIKRQGNDCLMVAP